MWRSTYESNNTCWVWGLIFRNQGRISGQVFGQTQGPRTLVWTFGCPNPEGLNDVKVNIYDRLVCVIFIATDCFLWCKDYWSNILYLIHMLLDWHSDNLVGLYLVLAVSSFILRLVRSRTRQEFHCGPSIDDVDAMWTRPRPVDARDGKVSNDDPWHDVYTFIELPEQTGSELFLGFRVIEV